MKLRLALRQIAFSFLLLHGIAPIRTQAITTGYCIQQILQSMNGSNLELNSSHPRIRKILDTYFDRTKFHPLDDLSEAELLAQYFGVHQLDDFKALSSAVRLGHLNDVFFEISKMPPTIRRRLFDEGARLDLVMGGVASHPRFQHLANVTPRGWPAGKTWSDIPGVGNVDTGIAVIAADKLGKTYHGSANLILHEAAHTLDRYFLVSRSREFTAIFKSTKWLKPDLSYVGAYPEEALAEGISRFYHGRTSNVRLKEMYPDLYRWINETYGPYQEKIYPRRSK